MKRRNLGISTVLSTIILSSALLVIIGIASYGADNAVNAQVENAQFDQAQNVMVSLAQVVKKVMFTPHSSGYVRSSFWTTLPQFEQTEGNLSIVITDSGENRTYNIPEKLIKIKAGSHVGVLDPRNVLGDNMLLLTNVTGSLGRVRVFQSNGGVVSLDYSRIRCVYMGTSNYYNGTSWGEEGVNMFEITLVKPIFGIFEPGTQSYINVQNLGIQSETVSVSKNAIVHVTSSKEGSSVSCTLADLVSERGGDAEKPLWIILNFINIEFSMFKEG